MRRQLAQTTAQPAPAKLPDAAVNASQAIKLAFLRMLAVASGIGTLALVGVALWQSIVNDAMFLLGALIVLMIGAAWTLALWWNCDRAERATWERETATGLDLNRDGQVGRPGTRFVPFTAGGEAQDPLVLESAEDDTPYLEGFELLLPDVILFIQEAGRRGLAYAAWCPRGGQRFKLVSGTEVTRNIWQNCTRELVSLKLARKSGKGLELTRPASDIVAQLRRQF